MRTRIMLCCTGMLVSALCSLGCRPCNGAAGVEDYSPTALAGRKGVGIENAPPSAKAAYAKIREQKDSERQIALCRSLAADMPNLEPVHVILGVRYHQSGQYEDALRELEWCIKNAHEVSVVLQCFDWQIATLIAANKRGDAKQAAILALQVARLWGRDVPDSLEPIMARIESVQLPINEPIIPELFITRPEAQATKKTEKGESAGK